MIIIIGLIVSVLSGVWLTVIDFTRLPQASLALVANRIGQAANDYAGGYLMLLPVVIVVTVVLQRSGKVVLNQLALFSFWFAPLLYLLNRVSSIYADSLFVPAWDIPYYVVAAGLAWVSWQTAKFMSGVSAIMEYKFRR